MFWNNFLFYELSASYLIKDSCKGRNSLWYCAIYFCHFYSFDAGSYNLPDLSVHVQSYHGSLPPCSTRSPCLASPMAVQQVITCTGSGEMQSQSVLSKQIPLSSPLQKWVSENWCYTRLRWCCSKWWVLPLMLYWGNPCGGQWLITFTKLIFTQQWWVSEGW